MREENKYSSRSRSELLRLEERMSAKLERALAVGRMESVSHLREELQLIHDVLSHDMGGVSSPEKFHKVTVELEVHIAEGTYFPESVEPDQGFKWAIFADSPHESDVIFNECRVFNIINNAITNIHGLSIGTMKIGTIGVGYSDEENEGDL